VKNKLYGILINYSLYDENLLSASDGLVGLPPFIVETNPEPVTFAPTREVVDTPAPPAPPETILVKDTAVPD